MNEQIHEALHRLWTKAVIADPDCVAGRYDKKEWLRLEALINDAEFRAALASPGVERRRRALLQAAATIYSGSLLKPYEQSQHPEPHYWENYETAVDAAQSLLAEIEKRESK